MVLLSKNNVKMYHFQVDRSSFGQEQKKTKTPLVHRIMIPKQGTTTKDHWKTQDPSLSIYSAMSYQCLAESRQGSLVTAVLMSSSSVSIVLSTVAVIALSVWILILHRVVVKHDQSLLSSRSSQVVLPREILDALALQQWDKALSWIKQSLPDECCRRTDINKQHSLLHRAVLFQAPSHILQAIIEKAPHMVSQSSEDGELPLHWCIRLFAPLPVMTLLLEADPGTAFCRDKTGISPLDLMWQRDQAKITAQWKQQRLSKFRYSWKGILLLLTGGGATRGTKQAQQEERKDDNGARFSKDHEDPAMMVLRRASQFPTPKGLYPLLLEIYEQEMTSSIRDDHGRTPLAIACGAGPDANRDGGGTTPTKIQQLLQRNTSLAVIRDAASGRLPLHVAASAGVGWNDGLEALLSMHPAGITSVDPITGLLPFQLAAATTTTTTYCKRNYKCDDNHADNLNTIYLLLRYDPSVLLLR
jgi:hypothetical protein